MTTNIKVDDVKEEENNALHANSLFYEVRRYAISKASVLDGVNNKINESLKVLRQMMGIGLIPYQNKNSKHLGKKWEELVKLGEDYFSDLSYSTDLVLVLYDWTTASFFRMKLFSYFRYTGPKFKSELLDRLSICELIWETNYPPYSAKDTGLMRSLLMFPSFSLTDVYNQLVTKETKLVEYSRSELYLINHAIDKLVKTNPVHTSDTPNLYSGQPDSSSMKISHFFALFEELSQNNDSSEPQLVLTCSIKEFFANNPIVTTKGILPTTDTFEDAMNYSKGLILKFSPPNKFSYWPNIAYVTPFSEDKNKTEFLLQFGSRLMFQSLSKKVINGREITQIDFKLDY